MLLLLLFLSRLLVLIYFVFQWLQNFWKTNSKCYVDRHGMDPFDICSVLEFLSEVGKSLHI